MKRRYILKKPRKLIPVNSTQSSANERFPFPNQETYQAYMAMERGLTDYVRKTFTKKERFVYFLKHYYKPGWGRRKIRIRTGISERQVVRIFNKLRDYA